MSPCSTHTLLCSIFLYLLNRIQVVDPLLPCQSPPLQHCNPLLDKCFTQHLNYPFTSPVLLVLILLHLHLPTFKTLTCLTCAGNSVLLLAFPYCDGYVIYGDITLKTGASDSFKHNLFTREMKQMERKSLDENK